MEKLVIKDPKRFFTEAWDKLKEDLDFIRNKAREIVRIIDYFEEYKKSLDRTDLSIDDKRETLQINIKYIAELSDLIRSCAIYCSEKVRNVEVEKNER